MNNEEWKDVIGFEQYFMVSDHGRVWSKRSNKVLSQGMSKTGYPVISTRLGGRKGKAICKKVHRWVAEAFIGVMEKGLYVNHKDGDKTNNHVSNLEWCTASENMKHAYESGLLTVKTWEENPHSKLNTESVRYIRENYRPYSSTFGQRALARKFSVNKTTIERVIKNESYRSIKGD